jgi:hypothetical protein
LTVVLSVLLPLTVVLSVLLPLTVVLSVLLPLTVVLSVLLRFETADYQFGIFKLFLALKLITHSLTEANQGCEIINQNTPL